MARQRGIRKVCQLPICSKFEPTVQGENKEEINLTVEEYETLRLIDVESFSQLECASYMNVARTTVQQIYADARKKVSTALVEGRTLRIEGGTYRLCDGNEDYCNCGGCKKHKRCRMERMNEE